MTTTMTVTYVLMILISGSPMQTMSPFKDRDACEHVRRQVEREFKPARSACIEVRN